MLKLFATLSLKLERSTQSFWGSNKIIFKSIFS